jgi:hypothetical protein
MARVRIDCLDDYLLGADHSERWVLRSDDLDYSRGVLSDTGLKVGRGSRSPCAFPRLGDAARLGSDKGVVWLVQLGGGEGRPRQAFPLLSRLLTSLGLNTKAVVVVVLTT